MTPGARVQGKARGGGRGGCRGTWGRQGAGGRATWDLLGAEGKGHSQALHPPSRRRQLPWWVACFSC